MVPAHIWKWSAFAIVLQGVCCKLLKRVNLTVAMEPLKVISNYREVECIFGCWQYGSCSLTSFKMVHKHNYTGVCSYIGVAKIRSEENTTGVVLHTREWYIFCPTLSIGGNHIFFTKPYICGDNYQFLIMKTYDKLIVEIFTNTFCTQNNCFLEMIDWSYPLRRYPSIQFRNLFSMKERHQLMYVCM